MASAIRCQVPASPVSKHPLVAKGVAALATATTAKGSACTKAGPSTAARFNEDHYSVPIIVHKLHIRTKIASVGFPLRSGCYTFSICGLWQRKRTLPARSTSPQFAWLFYYCSLDFVPRTAALHNKEHRTSALTLCTSRSCSATMASPL
jgi:hypothetical protein